MQIRVLNPAPSAARYVSLRSADRMVRHNRAIWSGGAIKLNTGQHQRTLRLPVQQATSTNRGIDTRGRQPLYDTPMGMWGLRPTA